MTRRNRLVTICAKCAPRVRRVPVMFGDDLLFAGVAVRTAVRVTKNIMAWRYILLASIAPIAALLIGYQLVLFVYDFLAFLAI